nr:hypothetical protein [Pirellulaceae bacterium]
MSNLSPNEDSKGTTINTGYCHQRWDGTGWETVACHCVYPYMPPLRDHPPTGQPGDEGYFPCISPFLSSAPGERGASLSSLSVGDCIHGPSETAAEGNKEPITTRNLLYHVYPNAANDVWLKNLRQLRKRLPIFNG